MGAASSCAGSAPSSCRASLRARFAIREPAPRSRWPPGTRRASRRESCCCSACRSAEPALPAAALSLLAAGLFTLAGAVVGLDALHAPRPGIVVEHAVAFGALPFALGVVAAAARARREHRGQAAQDKDPQAAPRGLRQ